MSGYGYMGASNSSSNNASGSGAQFQQNVWGGQKQFLKDMYNQAGQLFGLTGGQMQGAIPGVVGNMDQAYNQASQGTQNMLNGGAYSGVNGAQVANGINGQMYQGGGPQGWNQTTTQQNNILGQVANGSTPGNQFLDQAKLIQMDTNPVQASNTQDIYAQMMGGSGNTYADAMKDSYTQDANRASNMMLNNLDQRASAAGMAGSSRQGIAQAQGLRDINQNLQQNLAQTGFSTFDKDLQNKLNIAQQADANNLARYQSNLGYNQGLINSANQAAAQAQQYNLGLGGLGNQANQQNLGYNLGAGQLQAGFQQGMDQNNINRQNLLTNMVQGNQGSLQSGVQAAGQLGQQAMNPFNAYMAPWQAMGQWANTLGGPTILGSGNANGWSTGNSSANGWNTGGGGGATVICTELHRQGLMDDETYRLESEYGSMLQEFKPEVYAGYRVLADPVVKLMQRSPRFSRVVAKCVKPWVEWLTGTMGALPDSGTSRHRLGAAIHRVGTPVCAFIGRRVLKEASA